MGDGTAPDAASRRVIALAMVVSVEGETRVGKSRLVADPQQQHVEVIPRDQVERLLQPFQRLAPDRNGRRDGYGLGLAIVNAVTQAHHATLSTSARPEGGLSITVRFPPRHVRTADIKGTTTRDS